MMWHNFSYSTVIYIIDFPTNFKSLNTLNIHQIFMLAFSRRDIILVIFKLFTFSN